MKLFIISLALSLIGGPAALAQSPEEIAFFAEKRKLEDSILIRSSAPTPVIDVHAIRETCEYLTNDKIEADLFLPLPKRKTLLKLTVIDICETIELGLGAGVSQPSEYSDLLNTLNLIRASFYNKGQIEQGFSIFDILKIGIYNELSPWFLKFPVPKNLTALENPPNSVFWTLLRTPSERKGRFDKLAEIKQVSPLPHIVEFAAADGKGSSTKISVLDHQSQMRWTMKWGDEVHTDTVVSRLFAALGFYVDNSYYFQKNLILVFPKNKNKIHSIADLTKKIYSQYKVNLSPFVTKWGIIDDSLILQNPDLANYRGRKFVIFSSAALEARSDSETRLGGFMPNLESVYQHREVRGALLAHLWLNSWDIKSDNTLLAFVENGNKERRTFASFCDMGLSLGVYISKFPRDMKGGLVNHYSWDMLEVKDNRVIFFDRVNSFTQNYRDVNYEDLRWMAGQIAQINSDIVSFALSHSGWPSFLQELYLHKIMYRRQQILKAFQVEDPYPAFQFNKNLTLKDGDKLVVQDGNLIEEPDLRLFPQGLLHDKGRFRGFGW